MEERNFTSLYFNNLYGNYVKRSQQNTWNHWQAVERFSKQKFKKKKKKEANHSFFYIMNVSDKIKQRVHVIEVKK